MFVNLQNMYILTAFALPLIEGFTLASLYIFNRSHSWIFIHILRRILWSNGCRLTDCGLELQFSCVSFHFFPEG